MDAFSNRSLAPLCKTSERSTVPFLQCMHINVTVVQRRDKPRVSPWQEDSITELVHLCPFPLLPLERSLLGAAAAAAAPPVAAAQAPFSCSSPLLLVRLLFFPLLFFWLGILQDSDVKSVNFSTSISGCCHLTFLWTPWLVASVLCCCKCLFSLCCCLVCFWFSSWSTGIVCVCVCAAVLKNKLL